MRWVDVNDQLPLPQRRVLVAMHAGTEWEFKAVGAIIVVFTLTQGGTQDGKL